MVSLQAGETNAIFPLFLDDLRGEFRYDPLSKVVHEPLLEDSDLQLGVLASEVIYFEDCSIDYCNDDSAEKYIDEMIEKYDDSSETNGYLVVGFESSYEADVSTDSSLSRDRACKIAEDLVLRGISEEDIYFFYYYNMVFSPFWIVFRDGLWLRSK